MSYKNLTELSKAFSELRSSKQLHSVTEHRLSELLNDIYPEAYAKPEPGEIPGGRSDLAFYFGDGRYVVFEIFASKSQVPQDLRHLEQSNAQAQIAVLTDPMLDNGAVFDEYFAKKPRAPFPWLRLSEILTVESESVAKEKLSQYIREAFASDEVRGRIAPSPELRLKLYNMERDRTRHDEIFLETSGPLPQRHQFGFAIENMTESAMAKGISIRVEFFWQGHNISSAPSFQTPADTSWITQINQLVCEQSAVLTFREPELVCFYGQPIEWNGFRVTLREHMRGYLLAQYKIASIEPFTDNSGELRIVLGTK